MCESPDKPNLKHVVFKSSTSDVDANLHFIVEELETKGQACERVIIYCQSRKTVSNLYAMFIDCLSASHKELVNMYHTITESNVQEAIVKDFAEFC